METAETTQETGIGSEWGYILPGNLSFFLWPNSETGTRFRPWGQEGKIKNRGAVTHLSNARPIFKTCFWTGSVVVSCLS
ncbi:MAG: hypothetical protein ACO3OZ_16175 [bacterium]